MKGKMYFHLAMLFSFILIKGSSLVTAPDPTDTQDFHASDVSFIPITLWQGEDLTIPPKWVCLLSKSLATPPWTSFGGSMESEMDYSDVVLGSSRELWEESEGTMRIDTTRMRYGPNTQLSERTYVEFRRRGSSTRGHVAFVYPTETPLSSAEFHRMAKLIKGRQVWRKREIDGLALVDIDQLLSAAKIAKKGGEDSVEVMAEDGYEFNSLGPIPIPFFHNNVAPTNPLASRFPTRMVGDRLKLKLRTSFARGLMDNLGQYNGGGGGEGLDDGTGYEGVFLRAKLPAVKPKVQLLLSASASIQHGVDPLPSVSILVISQLLGSGITSDGGEQSTGEHPPKWVCLLTKSLDTPPWTSPGGSMDPHEDGHSVGRAIARKLAQETEGALGVTDMSHFLDFHDSHCFKDAEKKWNFVDFVRRGTLDKWHVAFAERLRHSMGPMELCQMAKQIWEKQNRRREITGVAFVDVEKLLAAARQAREETAETFEVEAEDGYEFDTTPSIPFPLLHNNIALAKPWSDPHPRRIVAASGCEVKGLTAQKHPPMLQLRHSFAQGLMDNVERYESAIEQAKAAKEGIIALHFEV